MVNWDTFLYCNSRYTSYHNFINSRKTGSDLEEALKYYYSSLEDNDDSVDYASDCIHENLMFLMQNADDTLKAEVREIASSIRANSHFMLSFQPQAGPRSMEMVYV